MILSENHELLYILYRIIIIIIIILVMELTSRKLYI